MDDEASPEPDPRPAADADDASTEPVPAEGVFHADQHQLARKLEWRLRRLTGRKATYRGPIVACTRAWVSRDLRWHIFAARFLDFVVLTPEHLVLCSTGFFTRRPRRQVLREPLTRLFVTTIGPQPARALRVVGDFSRPIRLEFRERDDTSTFVHELFARTPADARLRGDPWATAGMEPPTEPDAAGPEVEAE